MAVDYVISSFPLLRSMESGRPHSFDITTKSFELHLPLRLLPNESLGRQLQSTQFRFW